MPCPRLPVEGYGNVQQYQTRREQVLTSRATRANGEQSRASEGEEAEGSGCLGRDRRELVSQRHHGNLDRTHTPFARVCESTSRTACRIGAALLKESLRLHVSLQSTLVPTAPTYSYQEPSAKDGSSKRRVPGVSIIPTGEWNGERPWWAIRTCQKMWLGRIEDDHVSKMG